jgi:hypothetical protein
VEPRRNHVADIQSVKVSPSENRALRTLGQALAPARSTGAGFNKSRADCRERFLITNDCIRIVWLRHRIGTK